MLRFDEDMFYNQFVEELQRAVVGECKTVLDVGCGSNSPIQHFNSSLEKTVGVDLFEESLKKSEERSLHDEYHTMSVLDILEKFGEKSFDCVMALDVIEHLTPEEGLDLLEQMNAIAKKKVIIYTPNGYIPQEVYDDNELQRHKSGWSVEEMKRHGFEVVGMTGLKYLRGGESLIKYRPRQLWGKVSALSQKYVYKRPEYAYQLFCVKTL